MYWLNSWQSVIVQVRLADDWIACTSNLGHQISECGIAAHRARSLHSIAGPLGAHVMLSMGLYGEIYEHVQPWIFILTRQGLSSRFQRPWQSSLHELNTFHVVALWHSQPINHSSRVLFTNAFDSVLILMRFEKLTHILGIARDAGEAVS